MSDEPSPWKQAPPRILQLNWSIALSRAVCRKANQNLSNFQVEATEVLKAQAFSYC